MNTEENSEHLQRRKFFLSAASRAMKPLAEFIEKRIEIPLPTPRLRPPGAIAESKFNETCQRCNACVDICPADAIFSLGEDAGDAAGTPVIDPDSAACVVCEGLQCTHVCPSGALLPVLQPTDIRMGMAEVYATNCVRSKDEECTLCVDRCPLGEDAIRFNETGSLELNGSAEVDNSSEKDGQSRTLSPPEVLDGCVGCGVCQFYCPTTPKAIVIQPA